MALLTAALGWDATLTQMAWFFTKAALLTFGGAYAVLPYVYQGAVGHYGWLTPTQMIDGLALGESTRTRRPLVEFRVDQLGWAQGKEIAQAEQGKPRNTGRSLSTVTSLQKRGKSI